MRGFLIFGVALLLWVPFGLGALTAGTGEWRTCDATHKNGRVVTGLSPSGGGNVTKTACYDFTDTTDSKILSVGSCENFDVFFEADLATTDTVGKAKVYWCASSASADVANTCLLITNTTLDGIASTATDAIYGAAAVWIAVEASTNPSGDLSRLMVRCNGPSN
jgi:hypothetical protein